MCRSPQYNSSYPTRTVPGDFRICVRVSEMSPWRRRERGVHVRRSAPVSRLIHLGPVADVSHRLRCVSRFDSQCPFVHPLPSGYVCRCPSIQPPRLWRRQLGWIRAHMIRSSLELRQPPWISKQFFHPMVPTRKVSCPLALVLFHSQAARRLSMMPRRFLGNATPALSSIIPDHL